MKKEAFIFDMDGVIIDSEKIHARAKLQTIARFGLTFDPKRLSNYVGRTSKDFFGELRKELRREDISLEDMADYKRKTYLELLKEGKEIQPIPGALQLIETLQKAKIPLALATSSHREVTEQILTHLGIKKAFQSIISGSELKASKPDPAIYTETAKKLRIVPENCIVLEDSEAGIHAAKGAGMYCIAYRNPNSGNQDLSRADLQITEIKDIPYQTLFQISDST